MRILTCSPYFYYGHSQGVEPQFYYLARVPEAMGHEVDHFDYPTAARIGVPQMRRHFLNLVRSGSYDAVFIATVADEFDQETLAEARRHAPIFAWNSDDEWRWDDYSGPRADWYTFVVTNSPEIHALHKSRHPHLLHAQWACTGFWEGLTTPKDIPFSFVGAAYGPRAPQIDKLRRHGLQAYGKGTRTFHLSLVPTRSVNQRLFNGLVNFALRRIKNVDDLTVISFEQVNALWNRTRVSFTPLDSSTGGVRQIKSRIFDMGLSGTLMLAHRAPSLDSYYEPDREYVPFETLEECADKARFYLKNEAARRSIAEAYARRTRAEHMWDQRIASVLQQAGL